MEEEIIKKDDGLPSLAFVLTKHIGEMEFERVAFASSGHTIDEAKEGIAFLYDIWSGVKE